MAIKDFLYARLDEDERIAQAAIQQDRPGSHWQWVTNHDGVAIGPDWVSDELDVALCSVEQFPTKIVWDLPAFVVPHASGVDPGGGPHIARHDPARVLRDIAAKRDVIAAASKVLEAPVNGELPDAPRLAEQVLCALAGAYSDHDDFDPEWLRIVRYG